MSDDADKFWDQVAGKLRKVKGLCPLSPEEAEAAFHAAPEIPLSPGEVDSIVDAVTSGELVSWDPVPDDDGETDPSFGEVDEQVLQVFRHEGEDDAEADQEEQNLENELLNENDPKEDEDGLAGGAAAPGGGR